MRIAVKIGTTAWRAWNDAPDAGEVIFDGEVTDTLVWGDDVQNLREPTVAESLTAAKAARIADNRAECSRRIFDRYPAGRQSSVALGIYSGPEAEAQAQIMKDWISSMVAAENTAADLIEAATTVQDVEAVTVAWPA